MIHRCRRVYNNGDTVRELRDDEAVETWLEYNSTYRWGCTLLIDGELRRRGYHNETRAQELVVKYVGDRPIPSPLEAHTPTNESKEAPKENG